MATKKLQVLGPLRGEKGKDGVSCTHSWNGTTLTITSASGSSSANLKGEQGIRGIQGIQGVPGENGKPFTVAKTYSSIEEMHSDFDNPDINAGSFVVIVSTTNEEDNAKLFCKGETEYAFVVDLSGMQGIQGEQGVQGVQGVQGPAGYTPVKGVDYYTEADKNGIVADVIASLQIYSGDIVIPTIQPNTGERNLILNDRANGFAQWPSFSYSGYGTYSVAIKNGYLEQVSWTNDISEGQYINQTDGNNPQNQYFPRVYYPSGVKADEIAWAISEINDHSDVNDFEIYYSDDSSVWKKAKNVTIAMYNPSQVGGVNEFGQSCTATNGVRFIFDDPIEAKYFFAYDPNSTIRNISYWSSYFVAAQKG